MEYERFDCEKKYQITMCILKKMLQKKLITDEEFVAIEIKQRDKYQPLMGNNCIVK